MSARCQASGWIMMTFSVTLSETVTRKYNGRTYTIIKFVIPRALANKLKVYKGKEVELHLRGDRIIMLF